MYYQVTKYQVLLLFLLYFYVIAGAVSLFTPKSPQTQECCEGYDGSGITRQ